ncbi:MAG: tripartite tricarboxylate transporter substrate-binding protein [Pseudomonadota bacterium]
MKRVITAAVTALAMALTGATAPLAGGHGWKPEGPIKMIIAFRAGGGADTQARLIAEQIETATGWKIIPEQVTGKGGLNAAVALKKEPADGTSIAMVVTETLGYNAASAPGAGITPADVTGLTTTAGFQMGVVARSDKGWKTFDDMVAAAKAGEEIRFGVMSPKLADLAFLLGEANGVEFNIVSVRGGKAVMNGVTAGDMDVGFMAGIQAKGVAAGDLVNLASALSEPLKQTPEAKTMADLGVPFNADGHFVFVAPAGLPDEARKALTGAILAAVGDGKANQMITAAFGGPVTISGADLDSLLDEGFAGAAALMEAAQ